MQIESKIGKIKRNSDHIYNTLSDFTKIEQLIPPDKIKDASFSSNSCKINLPEMGNVEISIIEKETNALIKYEGNIQQSFSFYLWLQLKSLNENDTRFKITIKADIPKLIAFAVKGKIKTALDDMVDKIENI